MAKKMTEQQRKFADEYLKCGVAEKAALSAGYSKNYARVSSHKLLAIVSIKEYIEKAQQEMRKDTIASAEEVLAFLTVVMKKGDEVTKDRLKAAELLGKRHALFTDKTEVSGNVDVVIIDDVE